MANTRPPGWDGYCDCPRLWLDSRVGRLTKQEQLVLCVVLGLLLTGWAVKIYRAAHRTTYVMEPAKP